MICLRVKRVMVSSRIALAPVWRLTSSRAAAVTALASPRDRRSRGGSAERVSRREALSTLSVPNSAIAARTEGSAPNFAVVVTSSCATSDCICSSEAPYSEAPNPPNRAVPASMVISLARRSPWAIWWRCSAPSACQTALTDSGASVLSSVVPRGAVWANIVQPRSKADSVSVEVLAAPRSPTAMAIRARCSTARCIEVCSGAVSLSRNTSQRQNWRNAPPLR